MNEKALQEQLEVINRKVDSLLEEMALQQRHRREMEDLKEDLTRIGKDVYDTAVLELEDVHDYLNTGDILHLGKKILRNVNTLAKTIEQLESLRDLLQDSAPLARQAFVDFMNKLDEIDRKGYFAFAKEFGQVVDNVVTSFTPEDVRNLGDNIVTMLNTVKNLTQPDMLQAVNNAVTLYKKMDLDTGEDVSILALLKELRTPQARRGLAVIVQVLKSVGTTSDQQHTHRKGE